MKKLSKIFAILMVLSIMGVMLAACGRAEEPVVEEPAVEEPVVEEPVVEVPSEAFTIGISNPFISSEYRTQMIDNLIAVNEEYKALGLTNDLVIESFDTDVAGQIEQIENLINAGVDAMLVNPGDAVALNQILEEAVEMGIMVFSVDQEIEAEGVINVGHDQYEWARISAEWFAENLQEGNVVQIEGFIGHPANVLRMSAVADVFAEYPGINVLASESGFWDEATGQQVMSDFLAAYPNLDGYWTQDGMAIGALEAVIAANPDPYPLGVGEGRVKFLQLWAEMLERDPDFKTIAVANAPGVNATALRIAIEMLAGRELDTSVLGGQYGTTIVIDIPIVVTPDNFAEVYEEYVASGAYPDSYLLDGIMTRDEVVAAFFSPGAAVVEEPVEQVGPFTIGISNPFISSEYRTQMIDSLITINEEYKALGLTNDLVIESFDTDVAGQIEQIENLINAGVDAMLVNPGDAVALNQILEEAVEMGIMVFSVDQEIEAEGVINVGHDQYEWARISAEWFAENLQEGNVVQIEGFIGHPANVLRMSAVADVFAEYPGINVLASESGFWDEATGQQVMSDFLAAYPNLDGYWTQDGMAIGALEAVIAANPDPYPLGVGEGRVKFLQLWAEMLERDPDFKTIAVANAPGVNATALRIAIEMLAGRELDTSVLGGQYGTTIVIDIPIVVTPDNFAEVYEEYVASGAYPDSYLLDGIMTRDEVVAAFFN